MMYDGYFWGMGLPHLVMGAIVILVLAALIKYVFFR